MKALALIAFISAITLVGCAESPGGSRPDAPALSARAGDAEVSVELSVRDGSITTAERTHLTITTLSGESADISIPDLDEAMGDWTVTPDGPRDRSLTDGRVTITRRYTLEPFLPGEYTVPALEFVWTDGASGETGTLTTEPLALAVLSVLDDTSYDDFADLKDIATPEHEFDLLTVALLAGGGLALVAIISVFAIRSATRERERPVDRVPAHSIAQGALASLDPATVRSEASAVRFFDGVSRVVRTYIEDRFDLHAPDRTTEEFLRESASAHVFTPEDTALLGSFLTQCDLVKFARHSVDESDARGALDAARAFVERTSDENRVVVLDRETRDRLRAETIGATDGGAA